MSLSQEPNSEQDPEKITLLLRQVAAGDRLAEEHLIEIIYGRLKLMAARFLSHERKGHSLQPTALVHEAYLRLLGSGVIDWQSRAHFFRVASRTMRHVLIDHARKHLSEKAGGKVQFMELQEELVYTTGDCQRMLDLNELLDRLAEQDPRQESIVELRFFSGLTEEEIALLLGISSRTVKRDWKMARAWLQAELNRSPSATQPS